MRSVWARYRPAPNGLPSFWARARAFEFAKAVAEPLRRQLTGECAGAGAPRPSDSPEN